MTKNILVVGPDGFLAREVLAQLPAEERSRIVLLGRKEMTGRDNYFSDVATLKKAVPEIDVVYLLGAYIPYGALQSGDTTLVKTNIELVADISLSYPVSRIVFSSSVSVYGTPLQLPIAVDSPFNNPDLYGMSKLAGEAIVRNHRHFAIIRFSSIIGKGMNNLTMIPRMIAAAGTGTITVWGDGGRLQNYIDVRDAARLCLLTAQSDKNIVALGVGAQSHSNAAIAEQIGLLTRASVEFTGTDKSPSFVYQVDASYEGLNFAPLYSIEQTLNDLIKQ
jgi:UDP-glucose 4-epimerase